MIHCTGLYALCNRPCLMALLVGFMPTLSERRIVLIVRDPTRVAKPLDLSGTGAAARIVGAKAGIGGTPVGAFHAGGRHA
jgi:hypothetical protein